MRDRHRKNARTLRRLPPRTHPYAIAYCGRWRNAENTRRRAERTVHDTSKYAIADFAGELLAVPDNLQRTIAAAGRHSPERVEDAALLEGVRATERALMRALALGAPFDPAVHEAVREGDDGSYPPGSVARVLEDGYITCRSRRRREAPLE